MSPLWRMKAKYTHGRKLELPLLKSFVVAAGIVELVELVVRALELDEVKGRVVLDDDGKDELHRANSKWHRLDLFVSQSFRTERKGRKGRLLRRT